MHVEMASKTKLIYNLANGERVCVGELADRPLARMRGLIGRQALPAGEGVLLKPANSIHTAFMRFSIDVLFLDRDLRVLGIVERMRPWRLASKRKARRVLELSAGESARRGVRVGDRLSVREHATTTDAHGGQKASVLVQPPLAQPLLAPGSVIWPASDHRDGDHSVRGPIRVLIMSRDRHFRGVSSTLLSHHGCVVETTSTATKMVELMERGSTDVVVVEAGRSAARESAVAAAAALAHPAGIVVVDESPVGSDGTAVLSKWGPIEDLLAAVKRAAGHSHTDGARLAGD
jgi:uncharacterized membrane protein (UPF0127 family)